MFFHSQPLINFKIVDSIGHCNVAAQYTCRGLTSHRRLFINNFLKIAGSYRLLCSLLSNRDTPCRADLTIRVTGNLTIRRREVAQLWQRGFYASVGGSIFSTLVDERRAAAYQRSGIAFDVDQPERAGGGIAYRGTGPRITTAAQAEADKLAESTAAQAEAQTALLIDIQKSTTRTLRINDSWDVVGLPPERT